MKLRLQSNSIRLRLKRGEVEQLAKTGRMEEMIVFGANHEDVFRYILEVSETVTSPTAFCQDRLMVVRVSAEAVRRWASSDDVGMEAAQEFGDQGQLQILIEKDFACLNGPEEQNVDTFPNPLAGSKC